MKIPRSALTLLATLILTACVSSERPPSVVDIPSYREYISQMRVQLTTADPASFQPGEQAELTRVSGAIITTLGDATSYIDIAETQRQQLIALNEELHLLIFGENNIRAEERICSISQNTGSNIRTRSCRTRTQIAQDRDSARRLLEARSDDVDRNRILDESTPGGFGTSTLN